MMVKKMIIPGQDKRILQSLEEIHNLIDDLSCDIKTEKEKLLLISKPKSNSPQYYENTQSKNDLVIQSIKLLQANSVDIMNATNSVLTEVESKFEKLKQKDELRIKTIHNLRKIIQKNKTSIQASNIALNAINLIVMFDQLTGLPNRRLLEDRLNQLLKYNQRWGTYGAIIFLDLDKFKILNDEFGHHFGDNLLKSVAQRLNSIVRDTDTVSRYGGDEFVIVLKSLKGNILESSTQVEKIALNILNGFRQSFKIPKLKGGFIECEISASLGVIIFGEDRVSPNQLLDWADEAMYLAKSEGGNNIKFLNSSDSSNTTLLDLYFLVNQTGKETNLHGLRTREYVKLLATRALRMNLFPRELNHQLINRLYKTTQFHDIGKTKIPQSIISKNGKLTEAEDEIMKNHVTLGVDILKNAKKTCPKLKVLLDTAIELVESHHENWDGTGYPKGLVGNAIPLSGRIMAIADVYDSLVSIRSYKDRMSHDEAISIMRSKSGSHFDPSMIDVLLLEQEKFREISIAMGEQPS